MGAAASPRHGTAAPLEGLSLRRPRIPAPRVRVLLTDGAVLLLDHVLDAISDRGLTTGRLHSGLRVTDAEGAAAAFPPVLPLPILVLRLDVALRHPHSSHWRSVADRGHEDVAIAYRKCTAVTDHGSSRAGRRWTYFPAGRGCERGDRRKPVVDRSRTGGRPPDLGGGPRPHVVRSALVVRSSG
jgi:hypothetical protein